MQKIKTVIDNQQKEHQCRLHRLFWKKRAIDIIGEKILFKNNKFSIKNNSIKYWRPLCKKVLSSPLAFALPKSILKKDLIATDQRFPNRIGEIHHLAYNAKQKMALDS